MEPQRPEFSPTARLDLLQIVARSTEDWGTGRASRYRLDLERTCDRLALFPQMGRPVPGLADVRTPSQRHRIIYRPTPDGVLILRVVHRRMRLGDVDLN